MDMMHKANNLVKEGLGICRVASEQRCDEESGHCAHALQQLVDGAGVGHVSSERGADVAHDLVAWRVLRARCGVRDGSEPGAESKRLRDQAALRGATVKAS